MCTFIINHIIDNRIVFILKFKWDQNLPRSAAVEVKKQEEQLVTMTRNDDSIEKYLLNLNVVT